MMRRYNLVRTADPSGVSGTGKVAEIAEFTDGTAVLRWCTANHPASTQIHPSVDHIRRVHCHPGTKVEPIDEEYAYAPPPYRVGDPNSANAQSHHELIRED